MLMCFQFDPELVLVCAGFDSAIGDPEVRHPQKPSDVFCDWLNRCETPVYKHITLMIIF